MRIEKVNFESNQKDAQGEPLFNSGLAYLERMHKLSCMYHEAMFRKEHDIAYSCLSGLMSEASPRLTKDEFDILKKMRSRTYNLTLFSKNNNNTLTRKTMASHQSINLVFEEWFEEINRCLHTHGLVMPNKDDITNATKI